MTSAFTRLRWFRFSTRSLLVAVALFAIWLGWEVNAVRERKALLRVLDENGGTYWRATLDNPYSYDAFKHPERHRPPWRVRWLGDTVISEVFVPFDLPAETKARIRKRFPEAHVDDAVRELRFAAPAS